MIIIGLTGSIGMGKSNAARLFRHLRIPVHDADSVVHRLLSETGAGVDRVAALFPEAVEGHHIDRRRLGDRVFGDDAALRRLEAVLHPLVRAETGRFLRRAARRGSPIVVLDIPLLYESGGETAVDAVIVVSAPAPIQRQRVLSRPGMTETKFLAILARQMPDGEKRRRATHVIRTGGPMGQTLRQIRELLRVWRRRRSKGWRGRNWPPRRRRAKLRFESPKGVRA